MAGNTKETQVDATVPIESAPLDESEFETLYLERKEQNAFPLVKWSEAVMKEKVYSSRDVGNIQFLCKLFDVQSMHDGLLELMHSEGVSTGAEESEDAIAMECEWMRGNYYDGLVRFLVAQSFSNRKLQHSFEDAKFVPLLPWEGQQDVTMSTKISETVDLMTSETVRVLEYWFWQKWNTVEKELKALMESPSLDMFAEFVFENYFCTMLDCSGVKVAPDFDDNADQYELRMDMLKSAKPSDFKKVDEIIASKWKEKLNACSSPMILRRMSSERNESFFQTMYYPVLAKVLQGDTNKQQEVASAQIAAQSDRTNEEPATNGDIAGAVCTIPIIEMVSIDHMAGPNDTIAPTMPSPTEPTVVSSVSALTFEDLFSGGGYRTNLAVDTSMASIERMTAQSILEEGIVGKKCRFDGMILVCSGKTRKIEARRGTKRDLTGSPRGSAKKTSISNDPSMAIDMILLDRTGPIPVTLFGTDRVTAFTQQFKIGHYISLSVVKIVPLPKTEWNGESMTRIRTLHSIDSINDAAGTEISFSVANPSPLSHHVYRVPNGECCITHFMHNHGHYVAPFRATFSGIVMQVSEIEYSIGGNYKRTFILVDPVGDHFQCSAIRTNAQSNALSNGMYVVIYFASGRPAIGSSPSGLLIMDDAVIAPLKPAANLPELKTNIIIEGDNASPTNEMS